MKKFFQIVALSSLCATHLQAPLAKGDITSTTDSFSFNIGFAAYDHGEANTSSARLWIASGQAITTLSAMPYGLSHIDKVASYTVQGFQPVAMPDAGPENATIYSWDGTTASLSTASNPIWGAKFLFFDVAGAKPYFVVEMEPTKIYATQKLIHYPTPTETLKNITELLVHDFGAGDKIQAILPSGSSIYVAHSIGTFGADATSKIALLTRKTQAGIPYLSPVINQTGGTPILISTPALTAGTNDLDSLGSSVTMTLTNTGLYIGLDTKAKNSLGSQAVAITLTTQTTSGTDLAFNEIVPASVIAGATANTVVSTTAGNRIRITNIAGLSTSTRLQYLIVAQDTGNGPQSIYALPVVSNQVSNFGQVADFTSIKTTFNDKAKTFAHRHFDTVISDVTQIDPAEAYAPQLKVGAGGLPLEAGNSIKKLYCVGDSVYTVIGDAYSATQSPGTWRSQALFSQRGNIIGWTPWTRVLGSDSEQLYSFVDSATIAGFYVSASSTPGQFRSIYQTTFTPNSKLSPLFSSTENTIGGTQGLFDFPQQTPGFNNLISLMIATGFNKITIAQTGKTNGTAFAINPTVSILSWAGSTMNNHRAIVAAEIAHSGSNHWIFAGGSTGVSVLTGDATGYSWNGNLSGITELSAGGQTWKTVGDFSMVKKLVYDSGFIYILTSTNLYRIALDPNKFLAAPTTDLAIQKLASSTDFATNSYFLDIIIDGGFCIIGTTNGLFSFNATSNQLTKITIPDGLPAVTQLIAFSTNLEPQRSFKALSNLHVLNSSFGTQQARLNRFVIQNSTVTPFDDFIRNQMEAPTQGRATSFLKFNNYISNYFTDGSWLLASSYYLGTNQPNDTIPTPLIQQIFSSASTGFSSSQTLLLPYFSSYLHLPFLSTGTNLLNLIRESTSGAIVATGDFQSHVNA